MQDHVNKDLMFIGTEFGIFFTGNGGKNWLELDGGIPTISTRDVKIQRRENDLVAGTFGRGIYILDDYAPLRELTAKSREKEALLFAPSRPVKWFQLDDNHTDSNGDDYYLAKNPAHGATLTYYLKDSLLTAKDVRQAAEKKLVKEEEYPKYPSWESIEKENQEAKPAVYLEIRDSKGDFINRVAGKAKKGLHRVTWDMTHFASKAIVSPKNAEKSQGIAAAPGKYTATLYKREGTAITQLADPVEFELKAIYQPAVSGPTADEALQFSKDLAAAYRRSSATSEVLKSVEGTVKALRMAIDRTPGDVAALEAKYAAIQDEINGINFEMSGLKSRDRMGIKPASISSRFWYAMSANWSSYGPTAQHKEQFGYALKGLEAVIKRLSDLQASKVPDLQKAVIDAGGPWTKGAPLIAN